MIEAGQIAGLGIVGGLVWLWLKIRGVVAPAQDRPQPVGPGNSATPGGGNQGSSIYQGSGGSAAKVALSEYDIQTVAQFVIDYNAKPLNVSLHDMMTTAFIESTYRPWVERHEPRLNDYSVGLAQVLVKTAQDLYSKGYRNFEYPTRESLKIPAVSMYYGAAYFDWLKKYYPGKSLEWYVRAYNGGPGHNYSAATTEYWNKWSARRAQYAGVA